jgi:dTDP-glucose pyrophosphorylase/CBS domain-containing protein
MITNLESFIVSPKQTLRDAMIQIGKNMKGIVLVLEGSKLRWVITDGDMRRAVLRRIAIDTTIEEWGMAAEEMGKNPTVARLGATPAELLRLMRTRRLLHIPILDENDHVVGLSLLSELVQECEPVLGAVIMAGGRGSRLQPLTDSVPKPMLPVGDKPLLERTVLQLEQCGIKEMSIATCYKSEVIKEHFGNGNKFGVKINYLEEDLPLGTAGALGLMPPPQNTLLVINGDVLTSVDFRSMLNFHQENRAYLTVGVRQYEVQVPYGVVESNGEQVISLSEKPIYRFFVNAGIYLLEPEVYKMIPPNVRTDMTDLIQTLLEQKRNIVSFPVSEYWLDIGQLQDYERAKAEHRKESGV